MNELLEDQGVRDAVAFVGQTLGPLFLKDPMHDVEVVPAIEAFAGLDVDAAAAEWPFADEAEAREALALMKEGAAAGAQSDEVVWEYRRLFVGPAAKPAPPWGSVYTDRECVVFGKTCLDLRQWMREVGIERLGGENEPEDHVGLMLLLMEWIAQHKPEVLEDFLRLHLLPWSSHLLEELAEAARQPFYQGLALLAKTSLEGMQQAFGLDVKVPRFYR